MHNIALKFIDAVERSGSIRAAARHLNVASSSITRQIQNVEHRFDIKIFERGVDGVRVTEAGTILIAHIKRTLRDLERTKSQIEAKVGSRSGLVKIVAVDSIASSFLPNLLALSLEQNAGIRFQINIMKSSEIAHAISTGMSDIAISFRPILDNNLTVHYEHELKLGVLSAFDHPLAVRNRISLKEVLEYPIVTQSLEVPIFKSIDERIRAENKGYSPWIESDSISLIISLVETGRFVSLRTVLSSLDYQISSSNTMWAPLEDKGFPLDKLVVFTASNNAQSKDVTWMRDYIVNFIDGLLVKGAPRS
jgi:DNA-binding transcriptional LysR family regulator